MSEFLETSSFFGLVITLVVYILVDTLHRKFRAPLLNPLLLTIVIVIVFLLIFDIDYESYNSSAQYLSYFLTPATVCFAVPLYEKLDLLRRNWKALTIGIFSGVVSSAVSVYLMSRLFSLD
ncbi:MAG: LrgB family protein, partial [Oscillospiraceae bacterium]|nr:LrgB family protein [Oscillospiraceae bacterium]